MKKHNSTAGQRKATWAVLDTGRNPWKQLSSLATSRAIVPPVCSVAFFCHGAQFSLENNGTKIIGGRIPVHLLHPHEKCRIDEG